MRRMQGKHTHHVFFSNFTDSSRTACTRVQSNWEARCVGLEKSEQTANNILRETVSERRGCSPQIPSDQLYRRQKSVRLFSAAATLAAATLSSNAAKITVNCLP
jgi:hypothetical protein